MTSICECCQRNASQEDSFICSECEASQERDYTYDPTPEDESEVDQSMVRSTDHTPKPVF